MPTLPTHIAGIPLWAILFGATGLILFFLKISEESTNQDRYPTTRLFLYIGTVLIAVIGLVDFIRWAELW